MEKTSTPVNKKSIKREKPSSRVVENILKYSASLSVVIGLNCGTFLAVNN